jgi:hypothetical protein
VKESFTKIISNEVETVKFPHTLTVKQREFIHKKAQDLSLSTKSEGTRYRVLYLFKGKNLYDNRRKPQLISSQFQGATNLGLPNSQTVAEVCIAQPAQSSNEAGSQEKVECPVCKKLFAAGQRLRTHMSRMHKNEFKELKNTQ